jgi:hypothetical protein
VEVPAAETVLLMAGLHLGSVGKLRCGGNKEERRENVVRRGCLAMAPGEDFIGPASDGHARVAHIYASPCSEATASCAAGQSCRWCSYSAREARRRASGDDEVSVIPLIVGHAASYVPSRRPRSPSPLRGQDLDRVHRMKTCVAPDEKKHGDTTG